MKNHIFTGFGFGPIQAGLFVNEAFKSGSFERIVIAEIDQALIDAVRANGGSFYINVAHNDKIEHLKIDGVELYNPKIEQDRAKIIEAVSQSTEICTALPSVNFYSSGQEASVSAILAEGLKTSTQKAAIIYTSENNNHAAEILEKDVAARSVAKAKIQFLNTVIGKMSQVVVGENEIKQLNLKTIANGLNRAFLVESFNRILVTKTHIENFTPGIKVFIEKEDLLPFEEAKLYGHNAIHALLAYLGYMRGCRIMSDLKNHRDLMQIAYDAFINESGRALIKKYSKLNDELFTPPGFKNYAEDLLERMTNPFLSDAVARAARDPVRKLALTDRIFGTMSLALNHDMKPLNMAAGALCGLVYLNNNSAENNFPDSLKFADYNSLDSEKLKKIFDWLWANQRCENSEKMFDLVIIAKEKLKMLFT